MPLNKLDNFIKNTEGRILYVSPSDLDSTDSISNQGNSLAQPFKTLQRALLEAARFSYQLGNNNDIVEKTTILLMPGEHVVDNRPGYIVYNDAGAKTKPVSGSPITAASDTLSLRLTSNFDLTQEDNILYKFNSVNGGVVVPRGTSIVGLDLRKTKIRPKYVPNPTDSNVSNSAIFRITGACYFWQFSIFDGSESGLVYTDPEDYSVNNQSKPTFSHHKLTVFEYADGTNKVIKKGTTYDLTDLDMYYSKLSNAFNEQSGREIKAVDKYPSNPGGFAKQRPEWEIVGAFANDPIIIESIESGSGGTATPEISVKTAIPHQLTEGTPIKIRGVSVNDYNVSTKVSYVDPTDPTKFKYLLASVRNNLPTNPSVARATVTVETDTVSGASPYIFNISMRSVWGMNGMHADGSKASGFRSMVVAQFTGVSLQKDDRAFVKYNSVNRDYSDNITISRVTGSSLSNGASSTDTNKVYHLDSRAVYRNGWESSHIKVSNDSFIQVVSVFAIGYTKHFDSQTGGDLSITNSNSNFGQISLNAQGFKKEAFEKDNKAFITSIVTPRAIVSAENNVDWIAFDVANTVSGTINPNKNRLYLYGFTSKDDIPPTLTQGYRIGAKVNDKIYFTGDGLPEYSANILMSDGSTSSVKKYTVASEPALSKFSIGAHTLNTGEKVIILSDDGDLPENIVEHVIYYAITHSVNTTRTDKVTLLTTQIQLASSYSDALSGTPITVYKGTNLKILSRVSDKIAGELGSPVQYDTTNNQWYINTNGSISEPSQIWTALNYLNSLPVDIRPTRTEPSYVKRYSDFRSLDEKVYKVRVVIPKEYPNSKKPENGFVIQESSTTGIRSDTDINLSSLIRKDYDYNKNQRIIAKCTRSINPDANSLYTVTIISELPHNLKPNDTVIIKNVTDSTNASGTNDLGYNGTFTVVSVIDDMTFTYKTPRTPNTFTNNIGLRTTKLPRFERNDLQSNLYIYRNEVIKQYIEGVQDGIYYLYVLNSNNAVDQEFTNLKYSQNIVNFYPELDRDNIDDNPTSAKSFATRSPLGKVVTNDLKKSITKESVDSLLTSFGIGLDVSNIETSSGVSTITFARNHGLSGIVTYSSLTAGSGYTPLSGITTYYNVKLLNNSQNPNDGTWQGATATVKVNNGSVNFVDIISSGSGYSPGDLYFDTSSIGSGSGAKITIQTSGITTSIGNVVQFTGEGTTIDSYRRIRTVPATNQISVAKTSGDPDIIADQYAFVVAPSINITSASYNSTTKITTFNTTPNPHGLVVGNRFRVIDSNNNNVGDYIVSSKDITSFTAVTNKDLAATNGYILKHGLSANNATSDSKTENFGARSISIFDDEILTVVSFETRTQIRVSSPISASSSSIQKRFPLGSYIQIDDEIMRITSNYGVAGNGDEFNIERGIFGTIEKSHENGSLIRKIKPFAVEFRRPAILRASGHTFEYLGYGPGNYSTGLPQVQVKTLTEREDFLVQAQERSCGLCVYTGMNNNGDVFNGNTKTSASSGEVVSFDIPNPTVTGEDPSRLSVIYDEVTIKERLVVEGGNSRTVLSQFDGPVTFNKEVKINDQVTLTKPTGSTSTFTLKINNTQQSDSNTTGALILTGGAGISRNLNVGGNTGITGTLTVTDDTTLNKNVTIVGSDTASTEYFKIQNGSGADKFTVDSSSGNTTIVGTLGVQDVVTFSKNTDSTALGTGALVISAGGASINSQLRVGGAVNLGSTLTVTNDTTLNRNVTIVGSNTASTEYFKIQNGSSADKFTVDSSSGNTVIQGTLEVKSATTISKDTDSSSKTTGALIVSGGVGILKALYVGGDITAYADSDQRLKDNITPIPNALSKVLSISGNTFDWNDKSNKEGSDVGVIAQEILEILPEIVTSRDNGYLAVRYEKLVPLLIEAIKELKSEIDELKERSK